jgi:hypothetical protein
MRRFGRIGTPLAATLLPATALLAGLLSTPRKASPNAGGCTLHIDSEPYTATRCRPRTGSNCYTCEYSDDDLGYQNCSESPDGSIKKCGPWRPAP